jgi:hypothetical protein
MGVVYINLLKINAQNGICDFDIHRIFQKMLSFYRRRNGGLCKGLNMIIYLFSNVMNEINRTAMKGNAYYQDRFNNLFFK